MQHSTIGNTTTFYSTTEESRINTSVSSNNIKFLVKFTNDFSKNIKFAYAQNENINNRYTSFELYHNTNENILEGKVNLQPSGYWTYEIFEISFVNTPYLTETTAPLSDIIVLSPSDDNGINNGSIEIGKLLSSETELGKEVTYNEYSSGDEDSYIYPFVDSANDGVVYGCTNINSANYNANATVDDGSCTFHIYGCMDSNANNYDPSATIENGSCTFDISGCTDADAPNYDPSATVDDGSCITFENTKSLQFDGTTSYITVPKSSDYKKTDKISCFAWVKKSDWNVSSHEILFSTFRSQGGWSLFYQGKRLKLDIRIGSSTKQWEGGYNNLRTGGALGTDNGWHHLGFTFDGEFIKVYVDGVEDTTNTGTINLGSAGSLINYGAGTFDADLHVGAFPLLLSSVLDGLHDDLTIWHDALSDAEVSKLYNSGSILDPMRDDGDYTSSSDVVGWWRMGDDDTLPTITDNSNNSNDGTTYNMAASDISTDVPN